MKDLLFDLYGTLVDIKTDELCDAFWKEIALRLTGDKGLFEQVKYSYFNFVECLTPSVNFGEVDLLNVFKKMAQKFNSDEIMCDLEGFARFFRTQSIKKLKLFDGVYEMLSRLKSSGTRLYVFSNAQECFTLHEMERLGIKEMFDGIAISSSFGVKKPSSRFFEAALSKFGLSATNCLFIGNDLRDDISGSHAVGIKNIYIQTEQSGRYENFTSPDYIAENMADLNEKIYDLRGN